MHQYILAGIHICYLTNSLDKIHILDEVLTTKIV